MLNNFPDPESPLGYTTRELVALTGWSRPKIVNIIRQRWLAGEPGILNEAALFPPREEGRVYTRARKFVPRVA